ncbi:MAG: ABC transporter permease [Bacteroidetes bacterium]|jgi:ABC-2 type transport system permease protein|nr:ABC transporter permease [Bacteroidota bacterium]
MKYSQFRAMMAISKASFRSITRSPSAVVFTLAFPLIFILVFGFLSGGKVSVKLYVDPSGDSNNAISQAIQKMDVIKKVEGSYDKMQQSLQKGEIDGILKIEKLNNSNTDFTAHLITSTASPEKGALAHSILDNIINKVNFQTAHIQHPMAQLKQEVVPGREYKQIDFILPGQLGFALLSTGVFGTAFVFFSLRQTLVIKRFFATPVKRISIVFGEALSRMVFSLLGACFIITIGKYAFGFTLIHGWSTFLLMLLLCAFGLIIFMGFGFVVSGIAKSESTIPPISNIITLPQFLLAGTFFPIEVFPSWMQPICKAMPLTYLNDAMRKVAFEGAGLLDVSTQLLVLLGWGIGIYLLAAKTFRWE